MEGVFNTTRGNDPSHLLGLGVPAFNQHAVQAAELNFLWAAEDWPDAFGELLCYLKLVLSQRWPPPRQQLIEHHTIGEHVHLWAEVTREQNMENIKVRVTSLEVIKTMKH